jgi:SLT domain-containing protein
MSKKCIICEEKAEFTIKGSNENYCEECAKENFSDLSLLLKVEEQAQALKKIINQTDETE